MNFSRLGAHASAMACLALLAPWVCATTINLGTAGPGNWGVLEIGNGNLSIANASNAGTIIGNVGIAGSGNISDSGTPISGKVYLGTAAGNGGISPGPSGGYITGASGQATLTTAASDALYYSGFYANNATTPANFTNSGFNFGTGTFTLAGGVYDVNGDFKLNGATLNLTAGTNYIFNITGQLSLQGASLISDSTPDNVLFNIIGTHDVQLNGGLNQESILNGIILAPDAQVALSPGVVTGEIISGKNINIASGASVNDTQSVPDSGSTMFLIGSGVAVLLAAKRLCGRGMSSC